MNCARYNSGRLLLAILAMAVAGCSTVRVPAIDPSGQRIFLPAPTYTTLESPFSPTAGCWPQPAFREPPAIPPCPPAAAPVVVAPPVAVPAAPMVVATPQLQDRLILTPARIVAPINSEVVLLAGICGPDGYYVTRQPIEWSLSQESVGQFVDGGEAGRHHHFAQHHRQVENDHAVTHTSKVGRLITRGTPITSDDVSLRRGQAWVSVTSASQGISYVSAVAPGAENWEQRRQLARVHWVDAQWELPAPAVVPAGGTHTLVTRITRSSSSRPVTDWTVRYTIVGGSAAVFTANGGSTIEQPTDGSGVAAVTLAQQVPESGSTNIRIEILSPAAGESPVAVGDGGTTVTWSAPGLDVNATGPEVAATGATIVYAIEVRNTGDLTTPDTRVSATLPPTLEFLNSEPEGRQVTNTVQWQLGPLSAGESRNLELRCRAVTDGRIELAVEARAGQLSDRAFVSTQVQGPALEIRVVDPPSTALVGTHVDFRFVVTNVGIGRLENVQLRDLFDPGLEFIDSTQTSPIIKDLGNLEPGEGRNVMLSFIPRQVGSLCHTIEASSGGGYRTSERLCVRAEQARTAIQVRLEGPAGPLRVGQEAQFTALVTNTGDAPVSQVRIALSPDLQVLEPTWAADGYVYQANSLDWTIDTLAVGESVERRLVCDCLTPSNAAQNRVVVTTAEGAQGTDAVTLVIERPAPTPPPVQPRTPAPSGPVPLPSSAAGRLELSIVPLDPNIAVNGETAFLITVRNDASVFVRNVAVSFELPDALELRAATADPAALGPANFNNGRFEYQLISEIRPGGAVTFRVTVIGRQVGRHPIEVQAQAGNEQPETQISEVFVTP